MLVVCAARLEPRKAVDVLLHAFTRVHADHPEARLEVAGEGSERDALIELTTQLGLDGSVVFRGGLKRRDMPDFYARAAVFVLPSRGDEGLPKVVVEAALAGCAIVGTDVRGTTELVVRGVTGELVPPDDPVALGTVLTQLLADPERVARLAAAARPGALAHQERADLMGGWLERRIRALVTRR
jgi:phosphatidylinositol alpha-1,6-mannosyltransferase